MAIVTLVMSWSPYCQKDFLDVGVGRRETQIDGIEIIENLKFKSLLGGVASRHSTCVEWEG